MPDMRRRSPEPPPGAPQIQFKPGLANEMLRELAPPLAEEGIDVDNIDVPDLATLQAAMNRAVERSNMAWFTPVGQARDYAVTPRASSSRPSPTTTPVSRRSGRGACPACSRRRRHPRRRLEGCLLSCRDRDRRPFVDRRSKTVLRAEERRRNLAATQRHPHGTDHGVRVSSSKRVHS